MSEPYIAEIRIFAGNFAPRGYSFCNGQLLQIAQNTALFSLIGTTYGGDGRTTMGLPNLQGRAPMHPGRGPGLTPRKLGEKGGFDTVTLSVAQMPNHNHAFNSTSRDGRFATPENFYVGNGTPIYSTNAPNTTLKTDILPNYGNGAPHENRQPFLAMYFIIALTGVYPSRS